MHEEYSVSSFLIRFEILLRTHPLMIVLLNNIFLNFFAVILWKYYITPSNTDSCFDKFSANASALLMAA